MSCPPGVSSCSAAGTTDSCGLGPNIQVERVGFKTYIKVEGVAKLISRWKAVSAFL